LRVSTPFPFQTTLVLLGALGGSIACAEGGSRDALLAGKSCDDEGKCSTGFVCELTTRRCLRELPVAATGSSEPSATATVTLPVSPSSSPSSSEASPPNSGPPLNTQEADAQGSFSDAGGEDAKAEVTSGLPVLLPSVACGVQQAIQCGATEKCCAARGAPDVCVAAEVACCADCVEIACDGADDCAPGSVCCFDESTAQATSRCVIDGQCTGRPVCGEADAVCAERSCLPIDVRVGSCGL
jgi:hypothetical protein